MKLIVVVGLFVFSNLLSLGIAFPARNVREAASTVFCEIIIENEEFPPTNATLEQCINVKNPLVPTSIRISCNGSQLNHSYKLHGFSSTTCGDEDFINTTHLSARGLENNQRFAVINDRTPICSFRLHDNAIDPVKIRFRSTHNIYNSTSRNTDCVENLCGEGPDGLPKYAISVDLHELEDGSEANNSVDLFSDNRCENRIQNEGKFGVRSGADLVSLTRRNSVTVQSFRVTL